MKITHLTVQQKRLSTAEAELRVFVQIDPLDPAAQLRGRLTGPRCSGVETVQIAYDLKPIHPNGCGANTLAGRIVIPDPNFWTPEMPFVYEGNVEVWHEGKCVDVRTIRTAFKSTG
jgi:hypothetical protein